MEETNVSDNQSTVVNQTVPPAVDAVIPPTVPKQVPPTFTNNADVFKKLGAVVFILVAFLYVGNTFMTSSGGFSLTSIFPKDNPLGGKALYKKIANKEIIKEVKSLLLLDEKEGLLKDNKAVYRCTLEFSVYQNCEIQEVVKHPETFSRVTNIFGKDSESVYVIDEKTNNYKVLSEASAPTFRPLYNGMTESLMGLYAGDDFHLFKGEKILTIKSVPTGMNDALFYKEYKRGEADAPERHPYSRMAKGFDGDIQYMADDQFMYHGNGKASSTDPFIHLTKVEGADRATFTYYQQKMLGTAYLRYATDKNNVYCDNVTMGKDGYFTSDGLTVIKDSNPKSFQVIYPTDPITERNVGLQVAKTDTQVFVNCTLYPKIDGASFTVTDETSTFFKDKDYIYSLGRKSNGTSTFEYGLTMYRPIVKDGEEESDSDQFASASKKPKDNNFLDGEYSLVSSSPFYSSSVSISSSTEKRIHYGIDTTNRGHVGGLGGTAYRDMSTTSLVYVSQDFEKGDTQEGCQVTISFKEKGELTYYTRDKPFSIEENRYTSDCSSYRGAHGSFFDGDKHVRDLPDNLATLVALGFTENDRKAYKKLGKSVTLVERFANETITYTDSQRDSTSSAQKIVSSDIKNSFGYRIESANIYDSVFACDFAVSGGYCEYGAFIKNDSNGYWLMGGPNYASEYGPNMDKIKYPKKFIYRTTEKEWKQKLPLAFQAELKRLGLTENDVDFGK